jgi:nanoRNase/pAp phosphatase (c-di-AMP/oligoRNAs hydrolase)
VDTQPGAGNNPLLKNISAMIVIDHHPLLETSSQACFVDVRPEIGASATIITEYLQAAELEITSSVATALFYGIKTDTMSLGRKATPTDVSAYFFLQPKVNVEAMMEIERAQVPAAYFSGLTTAMHAVRLYNDDLAISFMGTMEYPDLGAEMADLLLRLKGVKWVICMGVHQENFILSVRSRSQKIGAGTLAQYIVGDLGTAGGHGTMAGGHIQVHRQDPTYLSDLLTQKALKYLKGDKEIIGRLLI